MFFALTSSSERVRVVRGLGRRRSQGPRSSAWRSFDPFRWYHLSTFRRDLYPKKRTMWVYSTYGRHEAFATIVMRLLKRFLVPLGAMVFCEMSLNADWIGPSDCTTCFGSAYALMNLGRTGATATTETWKFAYTIDTSRYTGLPGDYIGSVAVKVSSKLLDATLLSAPGGDVNVWFASRNTGLNNAGCKGGGSGWVCFSGGNISLTPVHSVDPVYTWDFTVTIPTGALLDTASIKANYDPRNGWITSESVSVPDGGSPEWPLAVFGIGFWVWWQKRSKSLMAAP